jgi:hypothetical protein
MRFAALFLTLLLQASQPARVASVSGEAEVVRGTDVVAARVGDTVDVGDHLNTRTNSSLIFSTSSGVTLQLNSSTRIELKKADVEITVLLTEGGLKVKSGGKPVRVETRYGAFAGSEDAQEFEVKYGGEGIQVTTGRGDRVYEAGSISPTQPRKSGDTTVIVYPEAGNRGRDRRDSKPK